MPAIFDTESLEGRIILLLFEIYPVTRKDIIEYLGASPKKADRALELLVKKGIVRLEPLPDTVYVHLASGNFKFKGKETDELVRVREKMKKRQEFRTPDDDDNPMYG